MDILVSMLERLNQWVWWALAGLILIAELLTGTTYLLWPAAAAFLTGFAALDVLGFGWPAQLALFSMLSVVLVWAGDRWIRPSMRVGDNGGLNDRAARMIGQLVVAAGDFHTGRGRVHYADAEWSAEMTDGSDPLDGEKLVVTTVQGVVLMVARPVRG